MKKMNWKKLFENRCPKCGCLLIYKVDTELFECALYDEDPKGVFACDFSISKHKIEIVKTDISNNKYLTTLEINTLRDHRDWNNYDTKGK